MLHTLKAEDLSQFTGTENWYRHSLMRHILYTDGVQHVAETGGAYWLIDKVATLQMDKRVKKQEFQVWTLRKVEGNDQWKLTAEDGNGGHFYAEKLGFSDFPLPEITFWFENNTIMLPSER